MSVLKDKKINFLMANYPEEGVATSAWLEKHGYYKQLVKQYCDAGWLTRLGKGAYSRLKDPVSWEGAVKALQDQRQLDVHVGGISALALYGITQYLLFNQNDASFSLFSTKLKKTRLPAWFLQYFKHGHYYQKKLFSSDLGVTPKEVGNITLQVSIPERAILEVLAITPDKITIQHASELIENLNRLRSHLVQAQLEACLSIKAKRLFLCLAELYNLEFFNELDIEKIDLGSGKRVIGKGGTYYSKWQLSLPSELDTDFSIGE